MPMNTNELYDRLKKNEEISRKFYEVEKKILPILEFKNLFEVLLTEIRNQFNVSYVWLSMVKDSDISHLIEDLSVSATLKGHINLIEKDIFLKLIGEGVTPIIRNRNTRPYFKLFPKNRNYLIRSIAICPITLNTNIIGSINYASSSKSRFAPELDTVFLEQLSVKVSLCISNVIEHAKLKKLAYQDPLTGLLNRRVIETILSRELNRTKRYKRPLSVAFLDLDYFKKINDSYGHDRGDDLLKYVSQTLKKFTRKSDVVARYAGDEFVIILPETGTEKAAYMMDRIRDFLKTKPFVYGNATIPVSLCCGIASTSNGELMAPKDLLREADDRLYQEKKSRETPPVTNKASSCAETA